MGLIYLYVAENCPWCYWCSLRDTEYGIFGEWAWVGRVYA